MPYVSHNTPSYIIWVRSLVLCQEIFWEYSTLVKAGYFPADIVYYVHFCICESLYLCFSIYICVCRNIGMYVTNFNRMCKKAREYYSSPFPVIINMAQNGTQIPDVQSVHTHSTHWRYCCQLWRCLKLISLGTTTYLCGLS